MTFCTKYGRISVQELVSGGCTMEKSKGIKPRKIIRRVRSNTSVVGVHVELPVYMVERIDRWCEITGFTRNDVAIQAYQLWLSTVEQSGKRGN